MTRRDALADGIQACKALTARYFPGFDDSNRTRQAPGLPNHFAWNLGHCALTMHRVAGLVAGDASAELPASDFIPGAARGDAARFGTESVAFGSRPADDPGAYPAFARCVAIYDAACDRFASAVRTAPESRLDEPVKWGPAEIPLYMLAMRMIFHNGDHLGQIADLRRALGFKPIFS